MNEMKRNGKSQIMPWNCAKGESNFQAFILGVGKWLASGFGHFTPRDDFMKGSGSSKSLAEQETLSLPGIKLQLASL
jgi:hypothetical protein